VSAWYSIVLPLLIYITIFIIILVRVCVISPDGLYFVVSRPSDKARFLVCATRRADIISLLSFIIVLTGHESWLERLSSLARPQMDYESVRQKCPRAMWTGNQALLIPLAVGLFIVLLHLLCIDRASSPIKHLIECHESAISLALPVRRIQAAEARVFAA
jgi:hypothetical protein